MKVIAAVIITIFTGFILSFQQGSIFSCPLPWFFLLCLVFVYYRENFGKQNFKYLLIGRYILFLLLLGLLCIQK